MKKRYEKPISIDLRDVNIVMGARPLDCSNGSDATSPEPGSRCQHGGKATLGSCLNGTVVSGCAVGRVAAINCSTGGNHSKP